MHPIIAADLAAITADRTVEWARFRGAIVLVTGANGFLPAYMVETLLFLNDRVFAAHERVRVLALVRNRAKAALRFRDYDGRSDLVFLVQDVTAPIAVDGRVDFIIHAASQASPKYYGRDPVGTLLANVLGCHTTLELARAKSATLLFFSSGEVYGAVDAATKAVGESDYGYLDPTQVRSCYGEGKRAGECMCVSYASQYGLPVKIVRPFHTYGPGMALDDGRVFADFVADIVAHRDIVMKSSGTAVRPFCYLADAVVGFFVVLLDGASGEAYNLGNPLAQIRIKDLAIMLAGLFPERRISVVEHAPVDDGSYLASKVVQCLPDIVKLQRLGWSPRTGLDEGFRRTVLSYG